MPSFKKLPAAGCIVSWAYPWPRDLRCSSLALSTATDALRCIFSNVDLSLDHNAFRGIPGTDVSKATDSSRCTCSGVGLSTATGASGCPAPAWTHPQVTVSLTRVHTGVPACLVQQHSNSSNALAVCQPRSLPSAVIRMFPGIAE